MVLEMPTPPSWVCHCGTPYADGYVFMKRPMQMAMSLWNALYSRAGRLKKIVSAWVGLDAVFRADSEYHI